MLKIPELLNAYIFRRFDKIGFLFYLSRHRPEGLSHFKVDRT